MISIALFVMYSDKPNEVIDSLVAKLSRIELVSILAATLLYALALYLDVALFSLVISFDISLNLSLNSA